ncbi:SEC-C metal-binding domain-containing protein [Chryseobacterium arthrosphaerae]|uniref:SEC-C domain-containing protein n=1 Tax=Chryseobacterium arthrosphaerae TaxID=651561 RepID=UPI001BAF1D00|nr:SEC-C domain-containing protein [Chryseobacterium arthrosphaerae]QUY55460.1 SEC-C domain-containing protein [Chryseobacterium arthrosphaerae]
MQQAINLTSNRNFKIRNFEEDKAAVLLSNPGLRYEGEVGNYKKFGGSYYLKNEFGELIESFNIIIGVDKKKYPNAFPEMLSIDDKIDKNHDYHIDSKGEVCFEHTYIANRMALGGIRLYDFINYYLPKYFSWILVKKYGNSDILEEWLHQEKGTIQFYQEILDTTDNKKIYHFLEQYCNKSKIQPNDVCYCGSRIKLKKCHYDAAILLKSTQKKIIAKDMLLFNSED